MYERASAPTRESPDMATSRIAMGKVRVARNKGEKIAAETLLDPDGNPTTDPNVMYRRPRGSLRERPRGHDRPSDLGRRCHTRRHRFDLRACPT